MRRFAFAMIFLAYAIAIIWEGVLFGSFNWMALACLSTATGMGLFFLRGWVTLAAFATSVITIAIWTASLASGDWPHSDLAHNGVTLVWLLFWIWCPVTVYRLARGRPRFSSAPAAW
jgi:hypothetical protein